MRGYSASSVILLPEEDDRAAEGSGKVHGSMSVSLLCSTVSKVDDNTVFRARQLQSIRIARGCRDREN